MVRLEGQRRVWLRTQLKRFNSYMVRLEVETSHPKDSNSTCFNSYMVRLEALPFRIVILPVKFQFLYGAIGRFNR